MYVRIHSVSDIFRTEMFVWQKLSVKEFRIVNRWPGSRGSSIGDQRCFIFSNSAMVPLPDSASVPEYPLSRCPKTVTYDPPQFSGGVGSLVEYRDFMYIRVDPEPVDAAPTDPRRLKSTDLAITRAQLKKSRSQGFEVHRRDAVTERISAAVATSGRPKFKQLLRQLRPGTALIVPELDCLGRGSADILKTMREIDALGAILYCMAISTDHLLKDLSVMQTLDSLAKLERSVAKTRSVAMRAGRGVAGGRIGRPPALDEAERAKVCALLAAGETISDLARHFNTSRQTILRVRDAQK